MGRTIGEKLDDLLDRQTNAYLDSTVAPKKEERFKEKISQERYGRPFYGFSRDQMMNEKPIFCKEATEEEEEG